MSVTAAHAEDTVYTVQNVILDKTAANSVEARDLAIEQGKSLAFKTLTDRLLFEEQEATLLDTVAPEDIDTLINDFEVKNERFSDRRYQAIMTVRFQADSVKRLLDRSTIGDVIELRSDPVLVLPYIRDKTTGKSILWSQDNTLLKLWQKMADETHIVPIVVPNGDIQDAALADESRILLGDPEETRLLKAHYEAERVVIVEAGISANGYRAQVYEYIGSNLNKVVDIQEESGAEEGFKWLQIVQRVQNHLNEEWKKRLRFQGASNAKQQSVLRVQFKSARDWLRLNRTLNELKVTQSVKLQSLKRDYADVDAVLVGSMEDIQNAFAEQGLIIRRAVPARGMPPSDIQRYVVFEGGIDNALGVNGLNTQRQYNAITPQDMAPSLAPQNGLLRMDNNGQVGITDYDRRRLDPAAGYETAPRGHAPRQIGDSPSLIIEDRGVRYEQRYETQ